MRLSYNLGATSEGIRVQCGPDRRKCRYTVARKSMRMGIAELFDSDVFEIYNSKSTIYFKGKGQRMAVVKKYIANIDDFKLFVAKQSYDSEDRENIYLQALITSGTSYEFFNKYHSYEFVMKELIRKNKPMITSKVLKKTEQPKDKSLVKNAQLQLLLHFHNRSLLDNAQAIKKFMLKVLMEEQLVVTKLRGQLACTRVQYLEANRNKYAVMRQVVFQKKESCGFSKGHRIKTKIKNTKPRQVRSNQFVRLKYLVIQPQKSKNKFLCKIFNSKCFGKYLNQSQLMKTNFYQFLIAFYPQNQRIIKLTSVKSEILLNNNEDAIKKDTEAKSNNISAPARNRFTKWVFVLVIFLCTLIYLAYDEAIVSVFTGTNVKFNSGFDKLISYCSNRSNRLRSIY
ncbi:uncharacterized protein LOC117134858 isoform X2 [Drosophila busckii]|uniref:uncharacterized protein LOC117134858 isoform X2 n=1 Tax=Drosophila busckii TaxID=30019 RepID=UPI001432DFB6|nr:uncharacterized protein LOC117134858 isoform X2 [Drosophila busckii]